MKDRTEARLLENTKENAVRVAEVSQKFNDVCFGVPASRSTTDGRIRADTCQVFCDR